MGTYDNKETKRWWAEENRRLARYESADDALLARWLADLDTKAATQEEVRVEDEPTAAGIQTQIALHRLELKAAQIIAELGMEEVQRRCEEMRARNRVEMAMHREYLAEIKRLGPTRRKQWPPHPTYQPDAWREWQYTRAFYGQSHH